MGNVYRVRTIGTGTIGGPYLSTQFYETTVAGSTADAQAAATKTQNFWSALSATLSTDLTLTPDTTVDLLDEISGDLLDSFTITGSITQPVSVSDALPQATQGLLRLLTGIIVNSRRVAGRIFIPGVTEGSSTAGVPTATFNSALDTAGDSLVAAPANPALAVWRRPVRDALGNLTRNGEAVGVNNVTPDNQWAILRSRRD